MRVGLIPTAVSPHAHFIEATLQSGGDWSRVKQILSSETLDSEEWRLTDEALTAAEDVIRDHVTFVSQTLGVSPQSTSILANGRVSPCTHSLTNIKYCIFKHLSIYWRAKIFREKFWDLD